MNMKHTILALLPAIFASCATTGNLPDGRWIDLSYDYSSETVYWPTSETFELKTVSEGVTEGGYYYSAYAFSSAEHGGTHLDAPVHFAEERKSVEELDITTLIGPAVVVDVSDRALVNPDYLIAVADLTEWERRHGRIPDECILLLRTGYGRYWPNTKQYLGTEERGEQAVAKLHFPGLGPDAAQWLVSNRDVKAVGIDTASIDYGQSKLFETHRILMERNIPAMENVANLGQVPATGAYLVALPMKIKGGSGAPVRIAALLPR